MKKAICAVMILALLCVAIPAQAGRLEDLQAHRAGLLERRQQLVAELEGVNREILRTEGALGERQADALAVAEEAPEKVEVAK